MRSRLRCRTLAVYLLAAALAACAGLAGDVHAHGEAAQEAFLRMSTIQWYDTRWSASEVNVNDEIVVTGRFHVARYWPFNVPKPEMTFLNVGVPGPVFVRVASDIGGVNAAASMPLELGHDYEYRLVLRARKPGRYHVHPMLDIRDAGPIVGPGSWVTVNGSFATFTDPITTSGGVTVDLERYGLGWVVGWHVVWLVLALLWLVYWLRKPLLIPRYEAVVQGEGEALITPTDRVMGGVMLAAASVIALVATGMASVRYPVTIPLQSNQAYPRSLRDTLPTVNVAVTRAEYQIPGRTVRMWLTVTNSGAEPVRLGEFTTANIRFLNRQVVQPESGYPDDLLAPAGLEVIPDVAVEPGQTRDLEVVATSVAWETERLALLIKDPTSRIGGLLMFFGSQSNRRQVVEVSSPVIPTFRGELTGVES
jgi:methane/ammonia monooxygenase subunit B